MKITVISVGKIKETYLQKGIDEYSKKIGKKHIFEMIELEDEKTPDGASEKEEEKIKEIEGKRILSKIKEEDYVIALCIEGKAYDNEKLKEIVRKAGEKRCVFIIGGSLGLSKEVVKRANVKISFSNMTFPHQLMRYMLLEVIESTI